MEKFEFENLAIVEDKQSKQTEQFSVMAKGSNYFCCQMLYPNKDVKQKVTKTLIR